MHESEKWKWCRSALSDSLRPHGLQLTRLLRPWDFPGKSTGVGCHCLLCPSWLQGGKYVNRIMEIKNNGTVCWNLTGLDTAMLNSFHESVGLTDSNSSFFSLLFSHSVLSDCNPMDCSTPGFPVFHYLPEFAQTYVHWIDDCGPKTKIRKKS